MRFEFLSSDSECGRFLDLWTKLAAGTDQADPFCCGPVWQLSFHEAFSPECRLFAATSPDNLIVFAERTFSPEEVFLAPVEASWFFGCPLLGQETVAMLAEAMVFFAEAYGPFFPEIVISGIRPQELFARRLLQQFSNEFDIFLHSSGVQCAASLHGGLDGFLSRRSANHRSKLSKAAGRAAREGISFERAAPATHAEAHQMYQRMLAVEETSWKGVGACGMTESPSREFYDVMLRRLSDTEDARIIFARHGDRDIGFIFGGMAGNVYRGQQFSYNEAWKNWSVGNLMQVEKIRWLCEQGVTRYDMGPIDDPRMEYKQHWTEENMEIQTWILVKR